jgi:hypothetical protein
MKRIAICTVAILVSFGANSAELTHNFNSPSFSGIGYSSHVLTIKQLEDQAKEKNQAKAEALKAQAERDAANTPTARFIANLESRIYSQLAKQLTDSMFGEGATCTTAGVVCGSIPDIGGNKIEWSLGAGSDSGMIVLNIQSLSNPSQTTTMKVPAGTFYF